jgi:hypothetical protein
VSQAVKTDWMDTEFKVTGPVVPVHCIVASIGPNASLQRNSNPSGVHSDQIVAGLLKKMTEEFCQTQIVGASHRKDSF